MKQKKFRNTVNLAEPKFGSKIIYKTDQFFGAASRILNSQYEKKFGFPFIMAVKGKDKIDILNNFRQRINNNIEFEFEESKKQVKKNCFIPAR